jgi:putative membrane protein
MRYLRYLSIAVLGLGLVLVALANRQPVLMQFVPPELSRLAVLNPTYEMPLFVVIYGSILAGLVIGFIWEWFREAAERAESTRVKRELAALREQIKQLKSEKHEGKDEVLALLDEAS